MWLDAGKWGGKNQGENHAQLLSVDLVLGPGKTHQGFAMAELEDYELPSNQSLDRPHAKDPVRNMDKESSGNLADALVTRRTSIFLLEKKSKV